MTQNKIAPHALGPMRFAPTTDDQFDRPIVKVSIADGSVLADRFSISHEKRIDGMKPVIDVEKMLEMKGAGMTNADIARALGVTTSAVWQQLRKLEVNIENAKSKTEASQPEPAEEVKEEQVQEETVDGFPEVEQAEEPASQVESPLERLNRDMAELHRQFKHLANITDVFNIIRDSFGTDTANRCLELIRPILDGEAI